VGVDLVCNALGVNGALSTLPQGCCLKDAKIGIVSYGTNDPAIQEARDMLAAQGVNTDYLRIRALPLAGAVHDFTREFDHVYLVENNFDAQMTQILRLDLPDIADRILPINKCDGLPLTAQFIVNTLLDMEG
jgi:2-oxoglutarate ferredoxin oxidoreductase subunit alpha